MSTMQVTCPDGYKAGMPLTVQTPSGNMDVVIPDGVMPGQAFQIQVPAQAVVAVAATPVAVQPMIVQPVSAAGVSGQDSQTFRYGTVPAVVKCIHCGHQGATRTTKETGLGTWLFCGGAVFVGCWLGCCLIPFCVDDCKDTHHHCSSCGQGLGCKKIIQ
jgi:lipopolysaccharide-induced tumor necrosis factor-alpha factor